MTLIDRPATEFDADNHQYHNLEGWGENDVLGVSTVAGVGGADDTWGIASAWGFRIGYEGAYDIWLARGGAEFDGGKEALREELKKHGLTPWSKRDQAASRGTWTHDILESLAQVGDIPILDQLSDEVRQHALSIMKFYVVYRPQFVAVEVQVASKVHGFAGRYDIRAMFNARQILPLFEQPVRHESVQAERIRELAARSGDPYCALCLVDLKTSKGVYPTKHFPQLSGYELASVEMNFPPTDAQFVLNSHADGSIATLVPSWSTPDDFVSYLHALRAIRRIKASDPENRLKQMRMDDIALDLESRPDKSARARDLAADVPSLAGLDGRHVAFLLKDMERKHRVTKGLRGLWTLKTNSDH